MIRSANEHDIEILLTLFTDTHSELEWYRQFPLSVDQIQKTLNALIMSPTGVVLVYVDHDDHPIGVILGIIDQLWFSTAKYAVDLALVVNTKNRYERIGYKLLKQFITYAKSMGVQNISTALIGEQNTLKHEALLLKLGYKNSGNAYEIRI